MSYNKDANLGLQVHEHLLSLGIETPFTFRQPNREKLQGLFKEIMEEVGLNLEDDSLIETPRRLSKLYTEEFFYGLDYSNFPTATVVENKMKYDEMVMERNVKVNSLCEHHFLPIVGSACIAYIPNETVIGLSKLNRIVDFFCRRPQIQERLTAQIHATLKFLLNTENVAVVIEAEHLCVKVRGVMDPCSDTLTSQLSGSFKTNNSARAEFFSLATGLNRK